MRDEPTCEFVLVVDSEIIATLVVALGWLVMLVNP
jgi:hypothetical protein